MSNQPMTIPSDDFRKILTDVKKPTFVNMVTKILVKMNKTDNIYHNKIYKTTNGNYFIGGTYEDMVNERMKKEGMTPTFVSESNSVGEHLSQCVLFNEKTNLYYLQYFVFNNSIHDVNYEFNGNWIDRELFRSFEIKRSESSRQPQENKHRVLSVKINNIKEMSLNGQRYIIN